MWNKGILHIKNHTIHYWVKHYDEGSQYGIEDEGRISKLMLKENGRIIANYDRGWDIEPETEEAQLAYMMLVQKYN